MHRNHFLPITPNPKRLHLAATRSPAHTRNIQVRSWAKRGHGSPQALCKGEFLSTNAIKMILKGS